MEFLVFLIPFFIIMALMLPIMLLQRKTCYYTFNGYKIKVFVGWINANLFVNGEIVDHQRCWGQGMRTYVLQHKEGADMEIFFRATSGIFRPRFTMKINNKLVQPD